MGYTNRRARMKWCEPHTKRLEYYLSANLTNTTINLAKYGHQALNLCLAEIFPPFQH